MALYDEIKQRLNKPATSSGIGNTQSMLQAKGGKALTGPKIKSQGARQAKAQGASALRQQQAQGTMQGAQAGLDYKGVQQRLAQAKEQLASQGRMAQAGMQSQQRQFQAGQAGEANVFGQRLGAQSRMQTESITNAFDQQLQNLASERGVAEQDIFESFRQGNEELEFRKDAAELQQAAFMAAMSNKQYIQELNNIATMNNLNDELAFKEELSRLILGKQLDGLLEDLGWQEAYAADANEFKKTIANMDIQTALDIAKMDIKQANNKAVIEGATTAASEYGKKYYAENN